MQGGQTGRLRARLGSWCDPWRVNWEERDADAALRADVRRVTTLLGHCLVRQEGRHLLDLVERVRALSRDDPQRADELLRAVDAPDAARLVRAFSAYFHLANVVEQVHRGRELRLRRAVDGGWLDRAARAISARAVPHSELADIAGRLEVRPVLTAHPTEAARRSTLTKLRTVAEVLDAEAAEAALLPGLDNTERTDRELAEVIDLLWLTDELRRQRPEPIDEARNAMFHLEDAARVAVPAVLRISPRCSAGSGSRCPPPPHRCASGRGPGATATGIPT